MEGKKKDCQSRILYPAKISVENEGTILYPAKISLENEGTMLLQTNKSWIKTRLKGLYYKKCYMKFLR